MELKGHTFFPGSCSSSLLEGWRISRGSRMFKIPAVGWVFPDIGREEEEDVDSVELGLPVALSSIRTFRLVFFINSVMRVLLEVSWVLSAENRNQ